MLNKLRSLFFSILPARRALKTTRAPHFTVSGAMRRRQPPALSDMPDDLIRQFNDGADDYYDAPDRHESWIDKPLSELHAGPDNLWRFGLLLSALQIRPEDRVLDFGCGTGWTSVMLARIGAEVTGMDISGRALDIARAGASRLLSGEQSKRLTFRQFGGRAIDVPDEYFDVIVIFDAFHHVPNPVALLTECWRILGTHGRLAFAEPGFGHSGSYTAMQEGALGVLESEVDPEQLRSAARLAGFQELELIIPPIHPSILTLTMPRARWYLRGWPWMVPHDYIRAAILSSPMGILRKGPYSATSLHPHTMSASIVPSTRSVRMRKGQSCELAVTVRNTAGTVWLREGRRGCGGVLLGVRVLEPSGVAFPGTGTLERIPRDMVQGDECRLSTSFEIPDRPGDYTIRLDLMAEGIGWFSERGSPAVDVPLSVIP